MGFNIGKVLFWGFVEFDSQIIAGAKWQQRQPLVKGRKNDYKQMWLKLKIESISWLFVESQNQNIKSVDADEFYPGSPVSKMDTQTVLTAIPVHYLCCQLNAHIFRWKNLTTGLFAGTIAMVISMRNH